MERERERERERKKERERESAMEPTNVICGNKRKRQASCGFAESRRPAPEQLYRARQKGDMGPRREEPFWVDPPD
jgi:hypothetical protein